MATFIIPHAQALDPNRAFAQYIRDRWTGADGYPGGAVNAIAQTPDGYLWIGAEKGLVRFDGLGFRLFNHANSSAFPRGPVLGLNADAQGNLWIWLQEPALLRYHDEIFEEVLPGEAGNSVITAMGRGIGGDVLLARPGDPLRYHDGKMVHLTPSAGHTNRLVISIAETSDGAIWMGTRDAGLFALRNGRASEPSGLPDRKVNCLLPGTGPDLWVGTDNGLARWDGSGMTQTGVPPSARHLQVLAIHRDRESNIWVGATSGLIRIDAHGVATAEQVDKRPTEPVTAIFEDREGNLWVGGPQGIQRYRDSVFLTYISIAERPAEDSEPLYADATGRVWLGPSGGGLSWLSDAGNGRFTGAGLGQDLAYSIDGGQGELWIGRQRGGLTRLRDESGSFDAETFTHSDGLAPGSVYSVHRNRDGTVWAGTLGGGVSHFRNGRFTSYTTANGLASDTVSAIEEGTDGTMWFATPNGLNAFSRGQWRVYAGQDGVPPGRVNCLTEDSGGVLWIGADAGLAFIRYGRVQTPRDLPPSLLEEVLGIVEDGRGYLWISTSKHVVRASRDYLIGNPAGPEDIREFGPADGIPTTEGVRRNRSVAKDRSGRIWFSLRRSISVVDPARLSNQPVPAIVHIQSVSADGSLLNTNGPLRIPVARRRITFSYAGLSLSVPERVRFRFRLDGFDRDWSEPQAARETFYTNLSPSSYRFRVIASNSEGVWNSTEASIVLEVIPEIWQTWWFRLAAVVTGVLGILAIYRLRLHRVTARLNLRFEERLAERTRIAQDLHDTLLQGLLSASMQLNVAMDEVPDDQPAQPKLQHVLKLMQHVVEEGRNAVRGLRSSGEGSGDLESAFARFREEHFVAPATGFRVGVDGDRRALSPYVRDEVYRIGCEALANAFLHSGAPNVELRVEYTPSHLRLLVRDDGCGIDPEVLRTGTQGHWGLLGMRERTARIGATLKVRSRQPVGTTVELTVPAGIAFLHPASARRKWWSGRRPS